jgi:hypothetical protein
LRVTSEEQTEASALSRYRLYHSFCRNFIDQKRLMLIWKMYKWTSLSIGSGSGSSSPLFSGSEADAEEWGDAQEDLVTPMKSDKQATGTNYLPSALKNKFYPSMEDDGLDNVDNYDTTLSVADNASVQGLSLVHSSAQPEPFCH